VFNSRSVLGVGNDTDGILVLGATNIPWVLDSAIRRRCIAQYLNKYASTDFLFSADSCSFSFAKCSKTWLQIREANLHPTARSSGSCWYVPPSYRWNTTWIVSKGFPRAGEDDSRLLWCRYKYSCPRRSHAASEESTNSHTLSVKYFIVVLSYLLHAILVCLEDYQVMEYHAGVTLRSQPVAVWKYISYCFQSGVGTIERWPKCDVTWSVWAVCSQGCWCYGDELDTDWWRETQRAIRVNGKKASFNTCVHVQLCESEYISHAPQLVWSEYKMLKVIYCKSEMEY